MKQVMAITFLFLFICCRLDAQVKFISTRGKEVIGVDGKPFLMKGTNLGNWLMPEGTCSNPECEYTKNFAYHFFVGEL